MPLGFVTCKIAYLILVDPPESYDFRHLRDIR